MSTEPILDKPIGKKTGWAGMRAYKDHKDYESPSHLKGKEVSITGYPGDKLGMYTMTGLIKKESDECISYKIDTYGGQSGSGILRREKYVIGIHTRGTKDEGKIKNFGVLLSEEKLVRIVEWIAKNWRYTPVKTYTTFNNKKARKYLQDIKDDGKTLREIAKKLGYDKSTSTGPSAISKFLNKKIENSQKIVDRLNARFEEKGYLFRSS